MRVAVSCSFSKIASRAFTARSVHPPWLSPVFMRTMFFVAPSRKIAIPSFSPAIAPTSARDGCPVDAVWVGAGLTGTGGGRRVGEKIGRSLVAVNDVSGIDHKASSRPLVGTLLVVMPTETGLVLCCASPPSRHCRSGRFGWSLRSDDNEGADD